MGKDFFKITELTPSKLYEVLNKNPIAYCAVSPIEWHGDHLPIGTDAMRAEWLIKEVGKEVGGVLLPTEYCGTDGLININGEEYWYLESIVDEKLLGNFLIDEGQFYNRLQWLIKNVKRNKFKIFVICTGHLSPQQVSVLETLGQQMNEEDFKIILWHSEKAVFPKELTTEDYLHAGVEETSEMLHINHELVDLDKLGVNEEAIKLGLSKDLRSLISKEFGEQRFLREKQQLIDVINKIGGNI